jgi:hypothetical protein
VQALDANGLDELWLVERRRLVRAARTQQDQGEQQAESA